jgi:hypothetical protein
MGGSSVLGPPKNPSARISADHLARFQFLDTALACQPCVTQPRTDTIQSSYASSPMLAKLSAQIARKSPTIIRGPNPSGQF